MADDVGPAAPVYPAPSRRTILKGAVVGAGAVFVAPTVLTMAATPAAASPAGCEICGLDIPINGAGNSLTGWTAVGAGWGTTGTVFQATGLFGALNRRERIVTFSPACVTRFAQGFQPPAILELGARLRTASSILGTNPSIFRVEFFDGPGATGTILATAQIPSTSTTLPASPVTLSPPIPLGTESLRVRLDLFGRLSQGQGAGLTLTVTTC